MSLALQEHCCCILAVALRSSAAEHMTIAVWRTGMEHKVIHYKYADEMYAPLSSVALTTGTAMRDWLSVLHKKS